MKPTRTQRQQRAARKRARRSRRLATGRRPRRFRIDVDAVDANIEMLMRPIREQSKPRQKKLDAEAKAKRKSR